MKRRQLIRIRKSWNGVQDVQTLIITRYTEQPDGSIKQHYVGSFEWIEYKGYDILDTTDIGFAGNTEIEFL